MALILVVVAVKVCIDKGRSKTSTGMSGIHSSTYVLCWLVVQKQGRWVLSLKEVIH